jgi:hypothetical protein
LLSLDLTCIDQINDLSFAENGQSYVDLDQNQPRRTMDINFIDPGGIDQDQPHSQESNAAEDRGDDASETMEEAEGDVNGGGIPKYSNCPSI